jgi:hypothetical protein
VCKEILVERQIDRTLAGFDVVARLHVHFLYLQIMRMACAWSSRPSTSIGKLLGCGTTKLMKMKRFQQRKRWRSRSIRLRRDRPILVSSGMSECKRAAVKTAIYLNSAGVR